MFYVCYRVVEKEDNFLKMARLGRIDVDLHAFNELGPVSDSDTIIDSSNNHIFK